MVPSYVIDKFITNESGNPEEDYLHTYIYCIHPSLLPKYRGACPIQHTLLNNDKRTGVTLVQLSKNKFDAGRVMAQSEIDVKESDTYLQLRDNLACEGGKIAAKVLADDLQQLNRASQVQDHAQASLAPLFKGDDYSYLDFNTGDSATILRTFKAFTGSMVTPSSHIYLKDSSRVLVFEDLSKTENSKDTKLLKDVNSVSDIPNGALYWNHKINPDYLYVKCADGNWLKFQSVKISGIGKIPSKKLMLDYFENKRYKENDQNFHFKLGQQQ